MKATLDSKALARCIELAAGGAADRRSPAARYHGVMVQAAGREAVQIYAESHNYGCVVQAPASVMDSVGRVYLDPVKALAYLKPHRKSSSPCTLRDSGVLAIGSGEACLKEGVGDGFALAAINDCEWMVSLVASEAHDAFDVASMVCKEKDDGTAAYFAIALCSRDEHAIDVVGTDARRLAHVELLSACSSIVSGNVEAKLQRPLVLYKTFVRKTLLPLLKSSGNHEVWFGKDQLNRLVFQDRISNWSAWTVDSVDRYVDWKTAIPEAFDCRAGMTVADLYNACQMASQVLTDERKYVSFEFGEETLAIFESDIFEDIDSRSPLATTGVSEVSGPIVRNEFKFLANPQLFCDVLKTVGGSKSKLSLSIEKNRSRTSSVLLTIHGWKMPCRFAIATYQRQL